MNATIKEIGIVRAMMKVARQRPRNRNTTMTTNSKAYSKVSCKLSTDWMMKRELSEMIWNWISEGSSFLANSISFLACSATSTALASVCLVIIRTPPSRRLMVCSSVMSLTVSRTVATSCR